MSFVKVSSLIDTQEKRKGKYQIQGIPNSNSVNIVSVNKTDLCIHEELVYNFICSLTQYTLSEEDMEQKRYFMIGYLIKDEEGLILAFLNLVFRPDKKYFEIVLYNKHNEEQVFRTLPTFPGNTQAIYMLTEILTEVLSDFSFS